MITPLNADLSNCDREQIQYAGAILPHGVLVAVSEPELTVLQTSVNSANLLGVCAEDLLGQPIDVVFDSRQAHSFHDQLDGASLSGGPAYLLRAAIHGAEFDVFAHRCGGVLIVEFETRSGEPASSLYLYSELRAPLMRLQAAPTLQSFLDLAARQIRDTTGFDRVMVYKFLEDGSGWVRSESLAEDAGLTPYLGLHYPPSDIPQPARRIFGLTWLRHQPDIGYIPVPISPANNPVTGGPLDLSYALLRSVSAMYSGYLKNMGTRSSMVMTLLKEGKLWGLIACHHHSGPKHVPYETRMACEFMANTVSLIMSAKEEQENQEYGKKLKSAESVLVNHFAQEDNLQAGLVNRTPALLDFVRAHGAAQVMGAQVQTAGQTPAAGQILAIAEWLSRNAADSVFATDSLSAHIPAAEAYKDVGSGLLALRFAKSNSDCLLWFRPERVHTVDWAGDPRKPVDFADGGQRLMPRTSFALWKETVRSKSEPWLDVEIEAVSRLRTAILEAAPRKLYEDLERSRAQLDSFVSAASHDLKEPLRGIHNYAEMLREDYGNELDEEGRNRLATIERLSRRMDELLDSLLEYSRAGHAKLAGMQVDLNRVVADTLEILRPRIEDRKTAVRIPVRLPSVRGDRIWLGEVFLNLIGNAIKYNDKDSKWIEIGSAADPDGRPRLYVRDNGIGIRPEHTAEIFQIFRRLHGRDEFGGGAGAGLTIAKKIVERHGGNLWVESAPGEETTFYFTLAP